MVVECAQVLCDVMRSCVVFNFFCINSMIHWFVYFSSKRYLLLRGIRFYTEIQMAIVQSAKHIIDDNVSCVYCVCGMLCV